MGLLTIVSDEADIAPLLCWGERFAKSHELTFNLVVLTQAPQTGEISAVDWETEHKDPLVEATRQAARILTPQPFLQHLATNNPLESTLTLVPEFKTQLIVLGRHKGSKNADTEWKDEMLEKAPRDTIVIRATAESADKTEKVLLPISGGPHCRVALRWFDKIIADQQTTLTGLSIQPDIGELSIDVGLREIYRAIKDVKMAAADLVIPKVVLGEKVRQGIVSAVSEGYDLLLVGASDRGFIRKTFGGTLPDSLLNGPEATAIAIIRGARPFHLQLRERIEDWISERVPQLNREERIDLFSRLQEGATGSFDFFALTCLATFIAAIGLIQNSTAVVIGAMLVAPLMIPMIGAGLGLVQGNTVLVRSCARSIALGFLCALLIGLFTGFAFSGFLPTDHEGQTILTNELLARGKPSVLDLLVALASGVAAAYANARPNLSSALPGVAIAAALVPPIATGGISLATGYPAVGLEAVTLFGTNLVAIVLGAAFALWIQGVRARTGTKGKIWARRAIFLLVLLTIIIGFYLATHVVGQALN